jgi:two-component system OmpR family response regulator
VFKILIVEDDVSIHNVIEELLKRQNYITYNAYSGTEAILLLEKEKYDLIILDLMLPAMNGEEIISKVKDTPIIVLSAKISSDDKVNCLMAGANDYITKPFDSNELLARIEVQLRQNNKSSSPEILKYKNLELLNDNHTLLLNHQKINLTKTEYAILKQLFLNKTQVIAKNKLLDLISIDTEDCDESSLKVHISNIRKKIKKVSDENYIESVWGIGFKMCD